MAALQPEYGVLRSNSDTVPWLSSWHGLRSRSFYRQHSGDEMASESPLAGSTRGSRDVYTLHNQPFSLFSIMVRFTYALGLSSADPTTAGVQLENKLVDHHRDENLAEGYLLKVNPKGQVWLSKRTPVLRDVRLTYHQVPALTGPKLSAPLTDSVDISYWLCAQYPKLIPPEHQPIISNMFTKLHDIHIFALSARRESMSPEWQASGIPPTAVDALLAKPDPEISPAYRRALEGKRELYACR